jgi:hypothetical protein
MWNSVVTHPLFYHWFLSIGLAFCALSISSLVRAKLLLRKGKTTSGRVVRLIEHGDPHESDITWSPVVEYEDSNGEAHEFECPVSSHAPKTGWQQSSQRAKPEFNIGDAVKVVYDPSNPGAARIKSGERIWVIPLFLGSFGAAMVWEASRHL